MLLTINIRGLRTGHLDQLNYQSQAMKALFSFRYFQTILSKNHAELISLQLKEDSRFIDLLRNTTR